MNPISVLASNLTTRVPMDDYTDNKAVQPPGLGGINTLISWGLWIAGAILFGLFIAGIVSAARSRRQGGAVDAEAPLWPLMLAVVLGSAGTIWNAIA